MAPWSRSSTEIILNFLTVFSASDTSPLASTPHLSSLHLFLLPPCPVSSVSPHLLPLLLRGHSLGFSSRGQELDQASRGWTFHPCSPAEEHSGEHQDNQGNLSQSNIDNFYMFPWLWIQRMMPLPPGLFLFLSPHLFHLGLTNWIKFHSKSPTKTSLEYTQGKHCVWNDWNAFQEFNHALEEFDI